MVRSLFPPPPAPNPPAMRAVRDAQAFLPDISESANRLKSAWSLLQADDSLRSMELYVQAARAAFESSLKSNHKQPEPKNEH